MNSRWGNFAHCLTSGKHIDADEQLKTYHIKKNYISLLLGFIIYTFSHLLVFFFLLLFTFLTRNYPFELKTWRWLYMGGYLDIFLIAKSAKVTKLSEKFFFISFTHSSRSNCKKDFLSFSSSSTQKKAIIKINGSLILLSMPHSHFHSHAEHYYYTKGKKRRKKTFKKHYTHSWRWWW